MTQRIRFALAGLATALLAAGAGHAQAADAGGASKPRSKADSDVPTWYADALAHSESGLNITRFWSKGALMRAETVVGGHKIVTIVNGTMYYAFDTTGMNGVAIHRSPRAIAQDSPTRRPFGREAVNLLGQGAEKVGEEMLLGRPCELLRVTDRIGRREVWVTLDEPRLPLRIQVYHRKRARTQNTDYINWLSGIRIADAFFQPDSQVDFERYELEEYVTLSTTTGPIGSVPVLYADLLHGGRGD